MTRLNTENRQAIRDVILEKSAVTSKLTKAVKEADTFAMNMHKKYIAPCFPKEFPAEQFLYKSQYMYFWLHTAKTMKLERIELPKYEYCNQKRTDENEAYFELTKKESATYYAQQKEISDLKGEIKKLTNEVTFALSSINTLAQLKSKWEEAYELCKHMFESPKNHPIAIRFEDLTTRLGIEK